MSLTMNTDIAIRIPAEAGYGTMAGRLGRLGQETISV